jgi:hypothetical protein
MSADYGQTADIGQHWYTFVCTGLHLVKSGTNSRVVVTSDFFDFLGKLEYFLFIHFTSTD